MLIPAYGTAMVPFYAIQMFPITSFTETGHPYQVRVPTPMERSIVPGHVIMTPDENLVRPRLRHDQNFDHDTQKMYHKALQAIHNMNTSTVNYVVRQVETTMHGKVHTARVKMMERDRK